MDFKLEESVEPRKLDNTVVALAKTRNGGLESVEWANGSWRRSDVPVGDILSASSASLPFLLLNGISAK
jgi:hypothetical protein